MHLVKPLNQPKALRMIDLLKKLYRKFNLNIIIEFILNKKRKSDSFFFFLHRLNTMLFNILFQYSLLIFCTYMLNRFGNTHSLSSATKNYIINWLPVQNSNSPYNLVIVSI